MERFSEVYRQHVRGVLVWLVRRSDPETGADLTAETFAVALEQFDRFDPARGDVGAWLHGIARNLLAGYQRTGRIERRAQRRLGMARVALEDGEIERIERLASLEVSATVLGGALADLPAEQREAVVARVVGERTYAEIGTDADVSPAVARKRVSRGLAALRQRLGAER